ncbi:Cytochrome c oxidase subunit CcoP [gamma proteobacterium IMCC2047]|nr:Cytochrome c oxidase subunit CcoP [gamma proteobacterium IMCC2047]
MSSFWSAWIIIITLGTIAFCAWLLIGNRKGMKNAGEDVSTTGHTYDGIEEYDNPLPRWWFQGFIITIIFALGYLTLYPGLGSFKGVLGWTQEGAWEEEIQEAEEQFASLYAGWAAIPVEELAKDASALQSGGRIFASYCSVCHGTAATGAYGFPNLTDNDWLYGGSGATIKETIMNGRSGAMPAWLDIIGEDNVKAVTAHVVTLSGGEADAAMAETGSQVFGTYCAACHGANGKGNQALGAPNLTDNIWIYGGSAEQIALSIRNGRVGNMPAHKDFLGNDKFPLLAAYVYSLSNK